MGDDPAPGAQGETRSIDKCCGQAGQRGICGRICLGGFDRCCDGSRRDFLSVGSKVFPDQLSPQFFPLRIARRSSSTQAPTPMSSRSSWHNSGSWDPSQLRLCLVLRIRGLVFSSNGEEKGKGRALEKAAYDLLETGPTRIRRQPRGK